MGVVEKLKGEHFDNGPVDATGQHEKYAVLPKSERDKGFVRPVRQSYVHVGPEGPKYPLRDLTDQEKEWFANATGPAAMDWEGIEIKNMSADQVFQNVVIEYATCGLKSAKNRYLGIENVTFQNNGAENFRYNDQKMDVQEGIPYSFREIIEEKGPQAGQNGPVKLEKSSKKMYWMLGGLGVGLAAAGIIYIEMDKAEKAEDKTAGKTQIQDPPGPPVE